MSRRSEVDVIEDLHDLIKKFGENIKVQFDPGFEATIPLRELVPQNAHLQDGSTLLKISWENRKFVVDLQPEDGIDDSKELLDLVRDKATLWSIIEEVFNFFSDDAGFLKQESSSTQSDSHEGDSVYTKFKNDFAIVKVETDSGDGLVTYKCVNKLDGMDYLVKEVLLPNAVKEEEDWLREVRAFRISQHPNVVRFFHAWIEHSMSSSNSEASSGSTATKKLYIATEFLTRTLGQMLDKGEKFDNAELLKFFRQIVEGIGYIHKKNVIHLNLTRDNIFIDAKGISKIGGFGSSVILDERVSHVESTSRGGHYEAPELMKSTQVNNKADMFSLGLILLEIMYPSEVADERTTSFNAIREGKLPSFIKNDTKLDVILHALLKYGPAERPSASAVRDWMDTYFDGGSKRRK